MLLQAARSMRHLWPSSYNFADGEDGKLNFHPCGELSLSPFILSCRLSKFWLKTCGSLWYIHVLEGSSTKVLSLTLWSCQKICSVSPLQKSLSHLNRKTRAPTVGLVSLAVLLPNLGHLIFYCLSELQSLFLILYSF